MSAFVLLILLLCAAPLLAAVPEGWFPFVTPLVDDSKTLVNVAHYNDSPAGEDGFVTIRDGHFVDDEGRRLRFLATNLTFAGCFPTHEQAEQVAARMAKYGINCVRFHHMDNAYPPRGIWDKSHKDKQHLDPEQLDRLDYVIYQLKLRGIYSNLNLHVSRKFSAADGFPDADELPNYDKGVDNFEPRMIELQKKYARDLLTHENPYTKTRYVDEPAIVMVELNNENSLLGFAFGDTLFDLPSHYRDQLQRMWIEWLREKYQTGERLRQAWDEGSEPLGEDMLANSDFAAGAEHWQLEAPKPAEAILEVLDNPDGGKMLHGKMTELGVQPWHFQIHQLDLDLQDGKAYTIRFRARSDKPRTIHVHCRYQVAPWRIVGPSYAAKLTPDWQEFEHTFRASDVLPKQTRLSFNCQNEIGEVWLADVSLRPGGILGLPLDQKLEDGSVDLPQKVHTQAARRDWFAFIIELERRYTDTLVRFLKDELKLRAPVIDTQASYGGIGGVLRESRLDYIDVHAYWQHPHFPGKPWDAGNWRIGNTSMVAALGRDTLTRLASYRMAGRAFTVSEYNHPAPNDYRAECVPMLAAFAALQDWDGIFYFEYGKPQEGEGAEKINGYFALNTDPAKMAFMPIAANLFRRGDVRAAQKIARLSVPTDSVTDLVATHGNDIGPIWDAGGVSRLAPLRHRVELELDAGDGIRSTQPVEIAEPRVTSDTGEILWDAREEDRAVFTVDTPRTKVIIGFVGDRKIALEGLSLSLAADEYPWIALGATAMDDRPLAESERILLVCMSRVENQDMGWNEERTTVLRQWGAGPTIAQGVRAQVELTTKAGLTVHALDGTGAPKSQLQAAAEDGRLLLNIDPSHETVWYGFTRDE